VPEPIVAEVAPPPPEPVAEPEVLRVPDRLFEALALFVRPQPQAPSPEPEIVELGGGVVELAYVEPEPEPEPVAFEPEIVPETLVETVEPMVLAVEVDVPEVVRLPQLTRPWTRARAPLSSPSRVHTEGPAPDGRDPARPWIG